MSHVDLCSGIGGFALGFEWAGLSKPVLFCDIEPWSRKVLAKHWPDVPIAVDVKELANDPDRFIPRTDPRNTILSSGYPCQPFSVAGKQRGTEDDRHIWPFISQIIAHKRPAWCVLENVYGHVALGLDEVLADLEAQDYATRAFIVPACGVNAPHRRDRLWIVANANSAGLQGWQNARDTSQSRAQRDKQSARRSQRPDGQNWAVEPAVGRVAHGIPGRVDRLKGLGNAIVPQIAMQIGLTIKAVRDE